MSFRFQVPSFKVDLSDEVSTRLRQRAGQSLNAGHSQTHPLTRMVLTTLNLNLQSPETCNLGLETS